MVFENHCKTVPDRQKGNNPRRYSARNRHSVCSTRSPPRSGSQSLAYSPAGSVTSPPQDYGKGTKKLSSGLSSS